MRIIKYFLFSFFAFSFSSPVLSSEITVNKISSYQQANLPKNGTYDGFIVYFKDDFNNADKKKPTTEKTAAQKISSIKNIVIERKISTGGYLIKSTLKNSQEAENKRIFNLLRKNPEVILVEPNLIFRATVLPDNDPGFSNLWGLKNTAYGVNAVTAWDSGYSGTGITVAVIDTGIINHPDLNANVLPGYDFISDAVDARDGNGRDADPSDEGDWTTSWFECGFFYPPSDSSWHGSHVAGTIAMVDNTIGGVGVAPDAKILPIRVLGKCGGTTIDITEGMLWAAGLSVNGITNNPNPAQIINMSLGGPGSCSFTEQSAINSVIAKGAVVIVAAGNENSDASGYSPSSCDKVLSVAALDENGNRASFSNYGNTVDLSAPGTSIYSTIDSGSTTPQGPTYGNYEGTSMATPNVAGVAALLLSKEPTLTPQEVMDHLISSAKPIAGTCSGGCGAGLVDAGLALGSGDGSVLFSDSFE